MNRSIRCRSELGNFKFDQSRLVAGHTEIFDSGRIFLRFMSFTKVWWKAENFCSLFFELFPRFALRLCRTSLLLVMLKLNVGLPLYTNLKVNK